MTDPIFKAPPVQAPNFAPQPPKEDPSAPVATASVSETPAVEMPQTQKVESPSPVVQPTVSEESVAPQPSPVIQQQVVPPIQPAELEAPVQNTQPTTQQGAVENPTNAFQQKLKDKLSKINLADLCEKVQHYLWYVLGGCFILGMMFGCSMGGSSKPQPVQQKVAGMEKYIVPNPDITKNYAQCGRTTSKTDPCIFYILNSDNREHLAEDFFADVVKKTNRNEFLLSQANSMYAKTLIPAGYFAKIHVPKS